MRLPNLSKLTIVTLLVLNLVVMTTGFKVGDQGVVRATAFELLNKDGVPVGHWEPSGTGSSLALSDFNMKRVVVLSANESEVGMTMLRSDGLGDKQPRDVVYVGYSEGESMIRLKSKSGDKVAGVNVGEATCQFSAVSGNALAAVSCTDNVPMIVSRGLDGRVLWMSPTK